MTYVAETKAGKAIRAIHIAKRGKQIANVTAHYSDGGAVLVNVRHLNGPQPMQSATAGGYGYDKFTAALSRLTIDGHRMTDHCGARIKPPRGKRYFPSDYKPRKGYRLANYAYYLADGTRADSFYWREQAQAQLGDGADWEAVQARADELKRNTEIFGGYSDCYRLPGLEYLAAIGYTIVTVL